MTAEIVSRILLGKEKMALEVVDCTKSQLYGYGEEGITFFYN